MELPSQARRHHPDLSYIYQRLDNSGTVIDVDPRLRDYFPGEDDHALKERVKIESVNVKLMGREMRPDKHAVGVARRSKSAAEARVLIDGDAFVVEFPVDQVDSVGRRASVLCFGYLPRSKDPESMEGAHARHASALAELTGEDDARSEWQLLRAALEYLMDRHVGERARPAFVAVNTLPSTAGASEDGWQSAVDRTQPGGAKALEGTLGEPAGTEPAGTEPAVSGPASVRRWVPVAAALLIGIAIGVLASRAVDGHTLQPAPSTSLAPSTSPAPSSSAAPTTLSRSPTGN